MISLLSSRSLALVLTLSYLSVDFARCSIIWNGNWAKSCDFVNNDLSNARTSSQDCLEKCNATIGCTHFTWTDWNGGSCWMKKGLIYEDDAFATSDPNMICGVLKDNNNSYVVDDTTTSLTTESSTSQSGCLSSAHFMLFLVLLFYFLSTFPL